MYISGLNRRLHYFFSILEQNERLYNFIPFYGIITGKDIVAILHDKKIIF